MKKTIRLLGILLSIFILTLSTNFTSAEADSPAPSATVIAVDIETDEFLATGGTGCSLREAIYSANWGDYGGCVRAGSGDLTVQVPEGEYYLTRHGVGEDMGEFGDLEIYLSMIIEGESMDLTIIDGDGADRIFEIQAGYGATVKLSDLTIRNGDPGSGNGGGIFNNADLEMTNVRVEGNQTDGDGGGIFHESNFSPLSPPLNGTTAPQAEGDALLTLMDSIVIDNQADGYGGGVFNGSSRMLIYQTSITNNTGDADGNASGGCGGIGNFSVQLVWINQAFIDGNSGGGSFGGGLCSGHEDGDQILIDDTVFYSNYSTSMGGNIWHLGSGTFLVTRTEISYGHSGLGGGIYSAGNMTVRNATLYGNTADDYGGAIYVASGNLVLEYATVVYNSAPLGGGVYSNADLDVKANILARNTTPEGLLSNCLGAGPVFNITSQDYNLYDGPFCAPPQTHDLSHTDPRLGHLGKHGGINITFTYTLQHGSPAIDAADPESYPVYDQRGIARPYPGGGVSDIGAFESDRNWWFLPVIRK